MAARRRLQGVFVAAVLAAASVAGAAQDEVSKIVLFDAGVSKEARAAAVRHAGGRVVRMLDLVDGVEAVFPAPRTPALTSDSGAVEGEGGLAVGKDGVSDIEDNARTNVLEQAAPAFGAFPAVGDFLKSGRSAAPAVGKAGPKETEPVIPWGVTRVNAPGLWARSQGRGVKVGVIDTGIDCSHPALRPNCRGGYNAVKEDASPADDHGHGTHVAGTIAANSREVIGVAPQASLYSIKSIDSAGRASYGDIIKGLEWAVNNNMRIVNMSLRKDHNEALELAVTRTLAAGVIIVAAAGNNGGGVEAPARYAGVIAVSASMANDGLAGFSSRGPEVAFIAPGNEIVSTAMGGGTTTKSGTSMAAPHVAGLAALALGLGHQNAAGVRQALDGAARPLVGVQQQGAGMIDAGRIAPPRR